MHASFYYSHQLKKRNTSHRLAIPAFLTAVEMAFTAVQMEFSRFVSSPVPWALLPSSRTNLVRVRTLVSKAPLSDILLSGVGLGPNALSEIGEHSPKVKKCTLEQRQGKGQGVWNSSGQSKASFLTARGWFDHYLNCGFKRAKFKDSELFFFFLLLPGFWFEIMYLFQYPL